MNIAVIPARGGSKRIPKKNIKDFFGKPMIAWTIETAIASKLFDRILVSTDDFDIAKIAKQFGAEVPFMRPAELSHDYAGTTEVIAHATQWVLDRGSAIQAVCCMYATAPFIRIDDLQSGLADLITGNWSYVFSATEFAAPIFRSFKNNNEGKVEMFFPDLFYERSQDLPKAFHDAGQFYWGKASSWIQKEKIFDANSKLVYVPRWRVQDIDTIEDWNRAELIFRILKSEGI